MTKARVKRLLKRLEWAGVYEQGEDSGNYSACPACEGIDPGGLKPLSVDEIASCGLSSLLGHRPKCELAAAIREKW